MSTEIDSEKDVDLSKFDEDFKEAPETNEIPDGKYRVRVERVELKNAKSSGNPMLSWQLSIADGPHAHRKLFRNNVISSKEQVNWLKADLTKCGLKLEKLSDLKNHLDELLDLDLLVTVKTRGDNQNVYIDGKPKGAESAAAGSPAPAPTTDVPF